MSDPMTNVDIEDVLASIRRLVSEDSRPRAGIPPQSPAKAAPTVARMVPAVAPAGPSDMDAPPDRLVLTPALRVAPDDPGPQDRDGAVDPSRRSMPPWQDPTARLADLWQDDMAVPHAGDAVQGDAAQDDLTGDAQDGNGASPDLRKLSDDLDLAAVLTGDMAGSADARVPGADRAEAPDEATLSFWSDEATDHLSDDGIPDALPWEDHQSWQDNPNSGTTDAKEGARPSPAGDATRLTQDNHSGADVWGDGFDPDPAPAAADHAGPAHRDAAGRDAADRDAADRDAAGRDAADRDAADRDEADLGAFDMRRNETGRHATRRAADPDGMAEDDPDLLVEESVIDEAMLRELVADIVRQELMGALGERITRNVRKLVRREIHRALSAQEFD